MHNWDPSQPANFEHNWYSNMFHQTIKQELPTPQSPPRNSPQLEHYLALKQQMLSAAMTPSPRAMDPNFNTGAMPTDVSSQQFYDASPVMLQQQHALGFNPLTPPGLPNAVLPSMAHFYSHPQSLGTLSSQNVADSKMQSTSSNALTPRNTPPMDVTPPKSPKPSHTSTSSEMDQDVSSNSSEDMKFIESEDDESIRMPIYNSHGKMKNHRCKHCGHLAITKVEFWEHARIHMKPEKTLQCFRCPFVTELKHHLEYHIRKHKNLKPFQCEKCSYTCVNKSMLNSHLKSHSSVYQYRCADCDYATKYCHSFKLHLRKYEHKPGVVLDEDGSPNPSVVIDVYGTRRGPKTKSGRKDKSGASKMPQLSAALQGLASSQQQKHQRLMPASPAKSTASSSSEFVFQPTQENLNQIKQAQALITSATEQQQQQQQQNPQQIYLQPLSALIQQRNLSLLPYLNLNLQMMAAQQQAILAQLPSAVRETVLYHFRMQTQENVEEEKEEEEEEDEGSAIDLTTATPVRKVEAVNNGIMNLKVRENDQQKTTPVISSTNKSRRKGRVLKLEHPTTSRPSPVLSPPATTEIPPPTSSFIDSAKIFDAKQFKQSPTAATSNEASPPPNYSNYPFPPTVAIPGPIPEVLYECKYCDIFFRSAAIYTIHMGYHSCDDVFTCNMCGEKCENAVGLFVHMARNPHF